MAMRRIRRALVAAGVLAVAAVAPAPSMAWEPTKPVEFIVPAGTGGGADQMARFLQGVVTKKRETSPLQIITLTSPDARYDALYLANFGTLQLRDPLARLPGVGDVVVFGIGEYSMRVWLDPELLRQRSLNPQDVINAIQAQNANVAAGQVGMPPTPTGQAFQLTANVPAALSDAREFGEIILKAGSDADGTLTRIKDVGRVELGARSYSQVFKVDGRPAGGIAIYQLPGANALATASGVRELLGRLKPGFPEDLAYGIPFDTTTFVRQSVDQDPTLWSTSLP